MTLVALTSLKYIFDEKKFTESFREAAAHLLKLDRSPEGKDFIRQSLSYFLWRWPNRQEDIKMDRPEIVARRGYETFAEHYVNVGIEKGRNQEREKTALDMLAENEPVEKIVKYTHLSEDKVLELQKKQGSSHSK